MPGHPGFSDQAALEQKIIEAYEGDVMGIYYSEYVTQ